MLINLRCVLLPLGHTQYLPDILPVHTFCCFAGSSFSFSFSKTAPFFSVFGIVVILTASHFKVLYIFRNMILMMKLKITTILQFSLIAVVITGAIAITAVYGQTTLSTAFTSPPPVPHSVIFYLNDATVYCADGTEKNNFRTTYPVLSTQSDTYSVYPSGHTVTQTAGTIVGDIHLVWTAVSDDGMHYHLKGLIYEYNSSFCPGTDDSFPVEIRGTCDGSVFAMTTPRINGYSVSANGTQIEAACIHP